MDEQNQIEIPQSFMALYCRNGRPFESRHHIEDRYDLCEDLANQTATICHTLQFKEDLPEAEVLRRCYAGLLAGAIVGDAEAGWVIMRTAELLQWEHPNFIANADAPS